MIGYDVGARFCPDDDLTGLLDGTDAPLPPVHTLIDDVFASSGRLPHIAPDATDNASEVIGALGDAAEWAGKMQVAGRASGGADAAAASNEAIPDPANSEQGAMLDAMSAIFGARFAGSMMLDGAGGKIGPYGLDYDDPSVPDAAVKVRGDAAGLEGLNQSQYFEQQNAPLGSILRNTGILDFTNESDSDGRMSDNPSEKWLDLYAKSSAAFDEGLESGDAHVLGALTGSGLTRSDEAAAEPGAMLEPNDERFFGSGYGMEQASSQGGAKALLDSIEKAKYPADLADFSGPEGEFYPFIRQGLAGDGIADFAVHDISRRAWDGQQLSGVGITNAGTMMLAPSGPASHGEETPSVESMPDLSGLWGMLRDAERILPKPSFADTADDRQAAANDIETRPSHALDMLSKLVATGLASHRPNESSIADEKVAPAGGRNGPTGHRNDPIYTVAISSMTGTLMPMVPTPGTSTRSPPIPGQRNLP